MTDQAIHEGGCLCGHIRYRIEGDFLHVCHCHCSLCRRSSGAAFLTWVAYPAGAFAFTKGEPGVFKATDVAERTFCPRCGTQLTFRHQESSHQVDVTAGSLDAADAVRPQDHIWDSSRLPWLSIDDGLPRHRGERGQG